jgi:hypothetical protein
MLSHTFNNNIYIKLKDLGKLWPESVSKLYRLSDRRLSAKLVPTFADRGCHVVNTTDPYGHILGFHRLLDKKLTVKRLTAPRDDVREEDLRGHGRER